tara:strand:- start:6 stop:485 length:480 start_codon:yes stop_codon:yes gene_type:complete
VRIRGILIETNRVQQNEAPSSNELSLPSVDVTGLDVRGRATFVTLGDGDQDEPSVSYEISSISNDFLYFSGSIDRDSSPNGVSFGTFFGGSIDTWQDIVVSGAGRRTIVTNDVDQNVGGYNSNAGAIYIFSASEGSAGIQNKKPEGWVALNPLTPSDNY